MQWQFSYIPAVVVLISIQIKSELIQREEQVQICLRTRTSKNGIKTKTYLNTTLEYIFNNLKVCFGYTV